MNNPTLGHHVTGKSIASHGSGVVQPRFSLHRVLVCACLVVLVALGLSGCIGGGVSPTGPSAPSTTSAVLPAGHGLLKIDTPVFDYVTYTPLLDVGVAGDPDESNDAEVVLPVGGYVVTVFLADTTMYVANVIVEDQETIVVTPVTKPREFDRVLEFASNYVVPLGDDRYVTYSWYSSAQVGVTGREGPEPFLSYEKLWSVCPAGGGKLLVFGDAGPGVYDPVTRKVTPFESDSIRLELEVDETYAAARCVGDATQFNFGGGLARVALSGTELIEFPMGFGYRASGKGGGYEGGYLADGAADTVVDITGNDHYVSATERIDASKLEPSKLIIAGRDLEVRGEIDLGRRDDIAAVQLSPGGSRVAVQFDKFICVYDTVTLQLLYTTPAWWGRFFWLDDNRFIYMSEAGTSSVLETNVDSRESYGLNCSDKVEFDYISGYFDGYLYGTGADVAELEAETAGWRGYRLAVG